MNWDKFSEVFEWETKLICEYQNKDIAYWINFAKETGAESILELGAGSGRITIPLLESGYNVTALDYSEKMLEKLSKNYYGNGGELSIVNADMCDFSILDTYDLCIVTYSSFQHILNKEDQLKCLNLIKNHLRPLGIAAFDLDPGVMDKPHTQHKAFLYKNFNSYLDAEVEMHTSWETDIENRIRHWYDDYIISRDSDNFEILNNHIALKEVKLNEMKLLLETSGFKFLDVKGGFLNEKFTPDSYRMVISAQNSNM